MMIDTPNKLTKCNVGDRIECQGHFGTVKYIGEVTDYKGIWLGINWDDPKRGKHNGTVNGIQYFIASSETSGSFVRLEKVQLGQSIITSVTSRYGNKDDELTAKYNQQQMLNFQHSINAPSLEFVGFDKITDIQSNYNDLKVVDVRLKNVKYIGDTYELKNLCPNLKELDISKNLITSWSQIFQICIELDHLIWLNVSENRLTFPENCNFTFPNLKTFICGSMELMWEDLLKLAKIFPNLETLVAPNNNITSIHINSDDFVHLKSLDLENNRLDWCNVKQLGSLAKLETLNLQNTSIDLIRFDSDENKTNLFASLNNLILNDNLINDWESIGELNKLQNLKSLKIMNNTLFRKERTNAYQQLIIGRIGNLEVLNGADIQLERKGAEYDYLKKYGLDWLNAKQDEQLEKDFLQTHNRYKDLINKYGDLEESELKVQVKTIQVTLIEIQLIYGEQIIIKKLPPSILIQKLILLAQRLFRLDFRPTLIYICNEQPDIEIILDDECKELGVYSIQNGDKIIIKT